MAEVPFPMVMLPLSAVAVTVPAPPVAMLPPAFWLIASPVTVNAPVVELTAAFKLIVPASALSITVPAPLAVTTEFAVKLPASTSTLILPLPPSVRTPVPPMIRPLVS